MKNDSSITTDGQPPPTARPRFRLPAQIPDGRVWLVTDSREQDPYPFQTPNWVTKCLTTGDYSVLHLEHVVAVERKSLPDLLSCIGQQRERFEKEIHRLLAFPVKLLVVEALWSDLERGGWRSQIPPASVIASLVGWMQWGLPIHFAKNHEDAGKFVERFLVMAARRRWREFRSLAMAILDEPQPVTTEGATT